MESKLQAIVSSFDLQQLPQQVIEDIWDHYKDVSTTFEDFQLYFPNALASLSILVEELSMLTCDDDNLKSPLDCSAFRRILTFMYFSMRLPVQFGAEFAEHTSSLDVFTLAMHSANAYINLLRSHGDSVFHPLMYQALLSLMKSWNVHSTSLLEQGRKRKRCKSTDPAVLALVDVSCNHI